MLFQIAPLESPPVGGVWLVDWCIWGPTRRASKNKELFQIKFFLFLNKKNIGASIRIGQEIRCLPYGRKEKINKIGKKGWKYWKLHFDQKKCTNRRRITTFGAFFLNLIWFLHYFGRNWSFRSSYFKYNYQNLQKMILFSIFIPFCISMSWYKYMRQISRGHSHWCFKSIKSEFAIAIVACLKNLDVLYGHQVFLRLICKAYSHQQTPTEIYPGVRRLSPLK